MSPTTGITDTRSAPSGTSRSTTSPVLTCGACCAARADRLRADVAALADALDPGDDRLAALQEDLRVASVADTTGGAGDDQVARGERDQRRDVLHQVHRPEAQLAGVRVLHDL